MRGAGIEGDDRLISSHHFSYSNNNYNIINRGQLLIQKSLISSNKLLASNIQPKISYLTNLRSLLCTISDKDYKNQIIKCIEAPLCLVRDLLNHRRYLKVCNFSDLRNNNNKLSCEAVDAAASIAIITEAAGTTSTISAISECATFRVTTTTNSTKSETSTQPIFAAVAAAAEWYRFFKLRQLQQISANHISGHQNPQLLVRSRSTPTEADAPSCSTSPSTNNHVSPSRSLNRSQQRPSGLADELFGPPVDNLLQEFESKPNGGMKEKNRLPDQHGIADQLDASSATSFSLDGNTQEGFSMPLGLDGDIQVDPRNNFLIRANSDSLIPNAQLSRGSSSSGKDMHDLFSLYGNPRDVETEVSTAAISSQSFGVPYASFKPGCSNDVVANENGTANRGVWGNQPQRIRTYTKVQKRGSVGRTIDVTRYRGYDELRHDLACMFGIEGLLKTTYREKANAVAMLSLLEAYAVSAVLKLSKCAHEITFRNNLATNLAVGTALLHMYARCGNVSASRKVFSAMPERNLVVWNAMISGYVESMRMDEARRIFESISEPDVMCWNTMISGYGQCGGMNV